MIRVLLFAGLAESAGSSMVQLELNQTNISIQDVRERLNERYPQLKDLLHKSMAAVNQEYANNDTTIKESDEVAFIPPVSGG